MELADGEIIVIEDNPAALGYLMHCSLDTKIGKALSDKLAEEFKIPFNFRHSESIDEAKPIIRDRYLKTQVEKKLYLSIGVTDLIKPEYKGRVRGRTGEFGYQNIALAVLENEIIPLATEYDFHAVFLTNVFNFSRNMIDKYDETNPTFADEFKKKDNALKQAIQKASGEDYLVEKEEITKYGEGCITDSVIKKVWECLEKLIRAEIAKHIS
jgi:hypothetical protein